MKLKIVYSFSILQYKTRQPFLVRRAINYTSHWHFYNVWFVLCSKRLKFQACVEVFVSVCMPRILKPFWCTCILLLATLFKVFRSSCETLEGLIGKTGRLLEKYDGSFGNFWKFSNYELFWIFWKFSKIWNDTSWKGEKPFGFWWLLLVLITYGKAKSNKHWVLIILIIDLQIDFIHHIVNCLIVCFHYVIAPSGLCIMVMSMAK